MQAMVDHKMAVTAATVATAAIAYLQEQELTNLIYGQGGRFKASKTWCNELLAEMNLTRRKCTTQASKLPADVDDKKRRLDLQVRGHSITSWHF